MLIRVGDLSFNADASQAIDLSIAVQFGVQQLQAFGAPAAHATPYCTGDFIGDVQQGGSCNCSTLHVTPHCNGTHTESVGHLTRDVWPVRQLARGFYLAQLISIAPHAEPNGDQIITRALLQATVNEAHCTALIVRTLPNATDKLTCNYDIHRPPYFTAEALAWLAERGIEHLLVDLPSVDRMDDGGHLFAHRAFWGLTPGSQALAQVARPQATITELIYVPNSVTDGLYLLNLNIAPFDSDAASSRPLIYPLQP